MGRFREIRECERPGNTGSKKVEFSEEAMQIYNSLFADDSVPKKVSLTLTENPEIKESIDKAVDAILSQPTIAK